MTQTPEHSLAQAAVTAIDELDDIRELSGLVQGLTMTLIDRARAGDGDGVVKMAEQLLPLHTEFARLYRTWLAAHTTAQPWVPSVVPAGRRANPGSDAVDHAST